MKIIENKIKRKCIITGQIVELDKLVRFDYDKKNNLLTLDFKKIKKGRGAYFIPTEDNWNKIIKNKGLNKAFRTKVSIDTYQAIESELKEIGCLKKIID